MSLMWVRMSFHAFIRHSEVECFLGRDYIRGGFRVYSVWEPFLVLLVAFASGDALGQKKNKKAPVDDSNPATDDDYDKIKKKKDHLTGTIRSLDSSGSSVTIRVETKQLRSPIPNTSHRQPREPKNTR